MSPLEEARNLIVRRWGEMSGYWGISRTMAELHALLFVTPRPLCTDDIMEELKISRGNASMNLRALVDWGLIRKVHKPGDRKEYFEADADIWRMFETIMRERRRREVEPVLATLERACELVERSAPERDGAAGEPAEFRRRVRNLQSFLTTMGSLFELVLHCGEDGLAEMSATLPGRGARPAAERSTRRSARKT